MRGITYRFAAVGTRAFFCRFRWRASSAKPGQMRSRKWRLRRRHRGSSSPSNPRLRAGRSRSGFVRIGRLPLANRRGAADRRRRRALWPRRWDATPAGPGRRSADGHHGIENSPGPLGPGELSSLRLESIIAVADIDRAVGAPFPAAVITRRNGDGDDDDHARK